MSKFDDEMSPVLMFSKQCKTCTKRAQDVAIDGKVLIEGYTKGVCSAYPDGKPLSVLQDRPCRFRSIR